MTREERLTVDAMLEYGGGFAKALGSAFVAADPNNRETIKRAFSEIWTRYMAMGAEQEHELTRDRILDRHSANTLQSAGGAV
jgi:hypothetical protein